ncbi:nucleoside-diphosphate sugar epimerase/dehydratase [Thermodesulfobacteriota bacterium]
MPYIIKRYYPWRSIIFFIGEGLLIFSSMLVAFWLFKGKTIFLIEHQECIKQALLVTIIFQLCLYLFDLYDLRSDLWITLTGTRITQAFGVGCIVLGVIYFVIPFFTIPTKVFWFGYLQTYLLILLWRGGYYFTVKKRMLIERVAVIGTRQMAENIARELEGRVDSPYHIVAFIGSNTDVFNPRRVPVYEKLEDIREQLQDGSIHRLVVALDERRGSMPVKDLLNIIQLPNA